MHCPFQNPSKRRYLENLWSVFNWKQQDLEPPSCSVVVPVTVPAFVYKKKKMLLVLLLPDVGKTLLCSLVQLHARPLNRKLLGSLNFKCGRLTVQSPSNGSVWVLPFHTKKSIGKWTLKRVLLTWPMRRCDAQGQNNMHRDTLSTIPCMGDKYVHVNSVRKNLQLSPTTQSQCPAIKWQLVLVIR